MASKQFIEEFDARKQKRWDQFIGGMVILIVSFLVTMLFIVIMS